MSGLFLRFGRKDSPFFRKSVRSHLWQQRLLLYLSVLAIVVGFAVRIYFP